jgi:hypothetical protein
MTRMQSRGRGGIRESKSHQLLAIGFKDEAVERYQSRLDFGSVQTSAELARFLGLSRARVTQILKRLKT